MLEKRSRANWIIVSDSQQPQADLDQTYFSKWIDYPCLQNGANGSICAFILIQAGWFLNAAVFDSPPVQSGLTSPTLQTTEKWKECDSHHTSSQQFSTIITTPNIFIGRVSESLCSTFLSTRKEKDHRSENQILFSCNLLCVFVVLLLWVFKWAVVWSAVSKKEVWQDLWRNLSFQWEQHLEYYNALLSFCLCLCSFANKKTPKLQNNSKSVMSCVHAGKVPK